MTANGYMKKKKNMKHNYFQSFEKTPDGYYIHINFMDDTYLLLDEYAHNLYTLTECPSDIMSESPELYNALCDNGFIISDDTDEFAITEMRKQEERYDRNLYHIIVNPTLDCNLSCWYCYEHKKQGSKISRDVLEGIKKNIEFHYTQYPFKTLKLSFFGGEPFLCFDAIDELSTFADEFCQKRGLEFLLDFTTNGTLLTRSQIERLSKYPCFFQITLDGNRKQHNKIKFVSDKSADTYDLTLNNIKMIDRLIPDHFTFVRINFDRRTLVEFDDILNEIKTLDRKKTKVILKRIWQVDSNIVDKNLVLDTIQKLFDNGFDVDYYTQGGLCFAERQNELVINFDGQVFKCTTIENFDKENSYGQLDTETGEVKWDVNRLAYAVKDMTIEKCKQCRLYPSCYGPCNNLIMVDKKDCYIDTIDLTRAEYFLFMHKCNFLKYQSKQ